MMAAPTSDIAVEFQKVNIVFGDHPQRALPLMDRGMHRTEIQKETGQILGVHDCSLTVGRGEILVLMGLSGSGKSTLLRAVNGLNPVCRGSVIVHDKGWNSDVSNASKDDLLRVRRECVAMVFQQFGLLPWRTVRENVGLGLELAGQTAAEMREKVDQQLKLVGLFERAESKVGELSGGMQQRVGLARAFVTDAPILLMDEPFSALDPLIRTRLQDELLELQAKLKRTIIFVSHDLDEAFKIGNRIALMEGGRIVQCGTAREIIANPVSDYVADFVNHMNPLSVLTARDAVEPTPNSTPTAGQTDIDTPIKDVMAQLKDETRALEVVDHGAVVGQVSRKTVIARLLDPRG
jgi:glycine betaine/proline transport system ATP-binding protein